MRRVSAIRDHEQAGFRQSTRDRRGSARACRTRRLRPARRARGKSIARSRASMFQRAELRRQPGVVPAAKRRVGVGVVPREARAAGRSTRRRRAPSRCWRSTRPRRTGAARPRRRRRPDGARACSSAIEAPSLCPNSQGRSMPSCANSAGSTLVRPARCMKSGAQRSSRGFGGRAAVAVAREDEAGEPCARAEVAREVLPHRDRAEAFVQEDDDRAPRTPARRPTRARSRGAAAAASRSRCSAARRSCAHDAVPRALALAQAKALDLAGRRLRQLVEELDRARVLVGGELFLDEGLELVLAHRRARLERRRTPWSWSGPRRPRCR